MTDEEKEALRNIKSEYETCDHYSSDLIIELDDAEILLNLIDKQSKEIEELKNEVMEKELIIDGMKEDRRIAVEEIQEQYYVSKDKLKAKIEEVEQWELYNMKIPKLSTLDERLGAKIGINYVLQSLLEKE